MKLKKMPSTVALLITSAAMLNACVSTTPTPPPPGERLNVVILPATHVQVVHASARLENTDVVVTGQVQRKKTHGRMAPKGHVDIAIVDAQGTTIRLVPVRFTPDIVPRMDGKKSSFTARIPFAAPPGSFISIKFHSGSHDDVQNISTNATAIIPD